jgi:ketose-bisphosphate aldolase
VPNIPNVVTLRELLRDAERGNYAVGSFAPRSTVMIRPVLRAGQRCRSPLIVQISEREFQWFGVTPEGFASEFYRVMREEGITVPVALHLDHTRALAPIQAAIAAGFTSVMIDASALPFDENVVLTRQVVEYAHAREASVEGELGKIGSGDFIETDRDEELYTDPGEAGRFVEATGVDALAVSVGTAHGVYMVRRPRIDYERLCAIRRHTPVHLVLHGGSGVPADMMRRAVEQRCGPISKVNIATDLELAALSALVREERLDDAGYRALPEGELNRAMAAVEAVVEEKITAFVNSKGRANGAG